MKPIYTYGLNYVQITCIAAWKCYTLAYQTKFGLHGRQYVTNTEITSVCFNTLLASRLTEAGRITPHQPLRIMAK